MECGLDDIYMNGNHKHIWGVLLCERRLWCNLMHWLDTVLCFLHNARAAVSRPIVLIPWVVLQELDSLKKGRDLSGSVAHLAIPAISYIYNSLKSKENRLWGQSMQQAAASTSEW